MKKLSLIVTYIACIWFVSGCDKFKKPSLAIVSPHLELNAYEFKTAAKSYGNVMQTDLYGVAGGGQLPVFSVEELCKHDLVIFESLGARISLIKPQIDSIKARTKVIFLETPLAEGNVSLKKYPDIKIYWDNGNAENYKGLLSYIAAKVFNRDVSVIKPVKYPAFGFYHPESDSLFCSASDYLKWYGLKHPAKIDAPAQPVIGLVFYQSNYIKHDMRHVDALIKSIERHGAKPVALMQKNGFKLDSFLMVDHKPIVDVVLYGGMYLNFSKPEIGRRSAVNLDVPLLGTATHYRKDVTAWEKDAGGFSPDMTDHFYFTERDGVIEPMIIGADKTLPDGRRYVEPIDYQINWRVERALAWAKLRHTANSEKKVVCTYYSEGSGKANTGADIDAYLDVQQSLVKLLKTWKDSGYNIGNQPLPNAVQLARQMSVHASNVGTWAPAELKKRMSNGDVIVIPEKQYLDWFHSYTPAQQQDVIKTWGPVPGKLMTLADSAGNKSFIIPVIKFGNIILAPHPNWGLQDNRALIYGKNAIPPSHAYIAFYEWMKRSYQPHAFLSLFTQLSLMPGKLEGPSAKDWNGELIGNIPHISMVPLISNAGVGNKRRASALTIGYLTEVTQAGLSDSLKILSNALTDWQTATNNVLRNRLGQKAIQLCTQMHIQNDMGNDQLISTSPDEFLKQVQAYIKKVARQHMANGGHVLGNAPTGNTLPEMINEMLGKEFNQLLPGNQFAKEKMAVDMVSAVVLHHQKADDIMRRYLHRQDSLVDKQLRLALFYQHQLAQAPNEITQIMRALEGKYIATGPTDDPIRNPESLPSGRNPYSIDSKAIPTKEAWALGKRMADQLLIQFEKKHGRGVIPKKVAFVLWSAEVTNNQGVSEAEIMYLMGVKPVWNSKGQVMDVALIPDTDLGRNRIDVLITTSGTYRDHFYGNIKMLDKAVKLAAKVNVGVNWVRKHSLVYQQKLGIDSMNIATLRVFSSNQGAYSTNIEFAGEDGEGWKSDTVLSNLYLSRMAHAYGEKAEALYQRKLFELNIKDVDAAAFSRSSNVYGVMDHPMVAAYFGAYNLAVKNTTGHEPDMFINDLSDTSNSEVTPLSTFFHTELRSRYLNPKWIKANMDHGYDGARYMDEFAGNLLLWNVTNRNMVTDQDWDNVYDTYVNDQNKLGVTKYLDKTNPYAKQSMLSAMLEASEKGYWKASEQQLNTMAKAVATSVANNGAACNTAVCNSPGLTAYIKKIVAKVPGGKVILNQYDEKLRELKGFTEAPGERARVPNQQVSGQQMTEEKSVTKVSSGMDTSLVSVFVIVFVVLLIFIAGWAKKVR
jgi:cobaltochelatase CobN